MGYKPITSLSDEVFSLKERVEKVSKNTKVKEHNHTTNGCSSKPTYADVVKTCSTLVRSQKMSNMKKPLQTSNRSKLISTGDLINYY